MLLLYCCTLFFIQIKDFWYFCTLTHTRARTPAIPCPCRSLLFCLCMCARFSSCRSCWVCPNRACISGPDQHQVPRLPPTCAPGSRAGGLTPGPAALLPNAANLWAYRIPTHSGPSFVLHTLIWPVGSLVAPNHSTIACLMRSILSPPPSFSNTLHSASANQPVESQHVWAQTIGPILILLRPTRTGDTRAAVKHHLW